MDKFLTGFRVLVVEDEMMIMMNIEQALTSYGCNTFTTAGTVSQALEFLKTQHFDLAMLDVNLGGTMSFPVADALALRKIPFLFSTGYGRHGIDPRFRGRPVLIKPYGDVKLRSALASLLPPDLDAAA